MLLKTNDIRNNILLDKGDDYFYISEATNNEMLSSQIESNDILINIVGATFQKSKYYTGYVFHQIN